MPDGYMEINYDSGNFTITGESVNVQNLEDVRNTLNSFMTSSGARVEDFNIKKWRHNTYPGYYEFLRATDRYFFKGNIINFNGETDFLKSCYNNSSHQAGDGGIFILKKDGDHKPLYSPIIGRDPLLTDSGKFILSIRGYKELDESMKPSKKKLLGKSFSKDLAKLLMFK